jgi:hypothetical protein
MPQNIDQVDKEHIEEIRIELDSMIKRAEYGTKLWDYLAKAKDTLGLASLEIKE